MIYCLHTDAGEKGNLSLGARACGCLSGAGIVLRILGAAIGRIVQRIDILWPEPGEVLLPQEREGSYRSGGVRQVLRKRLLQADARRHRRQRLRTTLIPRRGATGRYAHPCV